MSLTIADVKKVAHLARLAIEDAAALQCTRELCNILELVEQMGTIDTSNVSPMAHPLQVSQPLRPDIVTESNQRDLLLSIAPLTEAGLYLVPKVIE